MTRSWEGLRKEREVIWIMFERIRSWMKRDVKNWKKYELTKSWIDKTYGAVYLRISHHGSWWWRQENERLNRNEIIFKVCEVLIVDICCLTVGCTSSWQFKIECYSTKTSCLKDDNFRELATELDYELLPSLQAKHFYTSFDIYNEDLEIFRTV